MSRTPEILARLAAGERQADIARDLGISESVISVLRLRKGMREKGPARQFGWGRRSYEECANILEQLGFSGQEIPGVILRVDAGRTPMAPVRDGRRVTGPDRSR